MPKPRRRNIQLSPEVHEFLDAWQARDRAEGETGNAPLSAFIDELIQESGDFWMWEEKRELPDSGRWREPCP
jgi:hypothetical protein